MTRAEDERFLLWDGHVYERVGTRKELEGALPKGHALRGLRPTREIQVQHLSQHLSRSAIEAIEIPA